MASELLKGYFVGTVLRIDRDSRRLGVYIPKLMPTMSEGSVTSYTLPMNSGLSVGEFDTNVSDTVTKINYIMAKPEDWDNPLPDIGSKVMVYFIDDAPSQAIWHPFNPNGDNSVIAEERYPKSFTLTIGGKSIDVDKSDSIIITLPDYLTVTSHSDEDDRKSKTIDVIADKAFMNRTKALQEEVESLRKTIDCIIDESRQDALSGIESIKASESMANPYLDRFNACKEILTRRIEGAADLSAIRSAGRLGKAVLPGLQSLYDSYKEIYGKWAALGDDVKAKMPRFSIGDLKECLDGAFLSAMTCSDTLPKSIDSLMRNGLATSFSVTYSYIGKDGESREVTGGKHDIFTQLTDTSLDEVGSDLPAFPSSAMSDIMLDQMCGAFKAKWIYADGSPILYSDKYATAGFFGFYLAVGWKIKVVDTAFDYAGYCFTLDSGEESLTLDELNSRISGLESGTSHTITMKATKSDGTVDDLAAEFTR